MKMLKVAFALEKNYDRVLNTDRKSATNTSFAAWRVSSFVETFVLFLNCVLGTNICAKISHLTKRKNVRRNPKRRIIPSN